ncbi:nickel/cobalt transporter [Halodurantibacterium flavum]|uniref:Nickel/cobalt efflux system n=1 Tax=Halodurantibacterium flavum TaxID=1382802 RepID=A0ABW4S714_9RHOB
MRRVIPTLALALGLAAVLLWATGAFDPLASRAAEWQRQFQNAMADGLRSLRAGETGALMALMSLCFAYGFFHAVGPGHGKMLIGGYGVASRQRLGPMLIIALLSSLAQATTAVVLVYGGVAILGWTREQLVGTAEGPMTALGYAAVAAIGMWLAWRGARGLVRLRSATPLAHGRGHSHAGHGHHSHNQVHGHDHGHHHHDDGHCETCGHRHGPTMQEVEALRGWRDGAALIAGIALRPCTGALFLLILTWRMGLEGAGIAGAYVMGLGTATVTLAVAGLAVLARDGALQWMDRAGRLRAAFPLLELAAGATVAVAAGALLLRTL